ncbi:unnamed protein product [Bursaphelenchus xylophilus]|uniref:(pine wood nematode) hypothetical protein n=1 Tax=Bursaphelenchus xylophilus TaxID=6326 RepID=A0A1I7RIE0_BURXY|nr:unnamed protein product [Bursaphelenchus xylophilus]CAG9080885.1 unnamed protein product [Bursaphelenchus xylophilus]
MNQPPNHPTYVERTYHLHRIDSNPGVDYLRHPSGVIVMQLAASHPALTSGIAEVDFDCSKNKKAHDKSKQTVVGKGKKGGLRLQPETKLCIITAKDGTQHTIRAGIRALLIEVNAKLIDQPDLIEKSRQKRGYLAIIIPPAIMQNEKNKIPNEFGVPARMGTELPVIRWTKKEKKEEMEVDVKEVKVEIEVDEKVKEEEEKEVKEEIEVYEKVKEEEKEVKVEQI